ncbi:MAG: ABC transporter ATP-binding protein [Desulfatiglans sp.]|jgi:branched-chain amino acid transport system ATP-binding protein|nr:ABC transporter ATP-binding protein [Thermodesulfobacteriota bacterium]MEE4351255.1 ABC transporter ATP-binding protein [Desulfatiglans sp.]
MNPLLVVNNIEVIYHKVILVLKGMSLQVNQGQIVAVLGNNGAGKTTTLKAISGLLKSEDGEVTDGEILFEGKSIKKKYPEQIVRGGIFQVMEGRRVFEDLTVDENLIAGGHTNRNRGKMKEDMRRVYQYFPRLNARKNVIAGYISGGEQQMLVIGRGLMSTPRLMLLDEPSMGLSPLLVSEIFAIIQRINKEGGVSILLVEQNARLALSIANHGYVMENGRIVLDDSVEKLQENADVKEFYLGFNEVGKKKSYRDVKHYKRRKRWLA